ncbi:MAG TPA: serine/threonine-protein kinase, partial [Pyrinomonadaceae bacterium]|nr:serine/threonine-protein kinase [Pyrinomonadaceae bacterium]
MNKELRVGSTLSHYRIVSKIGEGGMGEVYLAQDTKLERKVALKILPADVAAHPDRMKRFVQEARAASSLNHPNIITIHEIGETASGHFIGTEFIDGETLRERMSRGGVELSDTLDIVVQVASALTAAHGVGIVHRDIKPENIMLRRDGIVKVLDFGLAKLVEQTPLDAEAETRMQVQTQAGMIVGTVAYMSPEQARGMEVDARTDVFSIGVVMYEMLAGQSPFAGETTSDVIAAILTTEPKPPSSFNQEIPAELDRIV